MNEAKIVRTDSGNSDFKELVNLLDEELKITNGEQDSFFKQFNKLDSIKHVVVVYNKDIPVACGAFKKYSDDTAEIKRMFTKPEFRGKGFGKMVLTDLENWAQESGFQNLILETAHAQIEAVGLYKKYGFEIIPNYEQYENVETSVCFKKAIK